jgi:hypothetical protein
MQAYLDRGYFGCCSNYIPLLYNNKYNEIREKIWKIWKKGKLNSGKIWKIKWWQTFVRNVIIKINNVIFMFLAEYPFKRPP